MKLIKAHVELIYKVPDDLVGTDLWNSSLKFVQDPIDPAFRLKSSKVIMVDAS